MENQLVKLQLNTPTISDSNNSVVEVEVLTDPMEQVDVRLMEIDAELYTLGGEIDNLTNQATKLDYTVSVASGVIAGLIDIFFVGKFDLQAGHEWSTEKVNSFVEHVAKKQGYTGNDTKGAIRYLEKYGAPSDSVTAQFGGGLQHHLRDFAHHASPVGLVFSMLTQFTGNAYGTNTAGAFMVVPIENKTFIGKDVPQKITLGLVHWMLHLASDMAGSSGARGLGTGIPGPVVSLVKLLSSMPIFNNPDEVNELSHKVSKLFNGTLLGEHDETGKIIAANPMDLRGELGVLHQLGKQTIPVIANEALVRGFYFISRLIEEIKEKRALKGIDWKKTAPFKNATIIRMLTISTGTFTAIDTLDAVIEGAINSKANWVEFGRQTLLRLNFVGIGRFTISLGSEVVTSYKRGKKTKEQLKLQNECLYLLNAKMYHGEVLVWTAAKDADESIGAFYESLQKVFMQVSSDMEMTKKNLNALKQLDVSAVEDKNPGLTDALLDALN